MRFGAVWLSSLLAAWAVLAAPNGEAQPLPLVKPDKVGFSAERLARLHDFVKGQIDSNSYSGAVTLIARHGKILDWQTFGYRDCESRLPMEKDSIVRIYSMSKIVTTVAAMMLYEQGKFGLDDPIGNFIPQLKTLRVFNGGTAEKPETVETLRPVSIKHLLTHTSGITYGWENSPQGELYRQAHLDDSSSIREFIARLGQLPLLHQPGEKWSYGYSIDVIGHLVEVISGQSLEDFTAQRIFVPLQMKDTGFIVPAEKMLRLARVYQRASDGTLSLTTNLLGVGTYRPGHGFPSGGGGLFSTIGDFARLGQMLLNGGRLEQAQILGRKTVELMRVNHLAHLTPPEIDDPLGAGFGLGGFVVTDLAKTGLPGSIGNFGWSGYASTSIELDFKEQCQFLFFFQHLPFNQDSILQKCTRLAYQALTD